MDFTLSKEQGLLRDGLTKFLSTRYDLTASRATAKTGAGWNPAIWASFAEELGILAAPLPERAGGLGGGAEEIMVITEALGHALVIEPYVGTVVVAGSLLAQAGTEPADELLGRIAEGDAVVALAQGPALHASGDGADWVITGSADVVADAPLATHLLIAADAGLFVTELESGAPPSGLTVHGYRTIDDRRAADLVFDGLRVGAPLLADATAALARAQDEGTAAVCSEAVGLMRKVLADTVEYSKQRQQFGQPIGHFQVLQHRMVDMYMETEQAVAAVYLAVLNLDADPADRARAVSAAKATVGRAARFVGQNAVQLHGAMGMTEELAVGHYFKRLTAIQYEFGTVDQHLSRYAEVWLKA